MSAPTPAAFAALLIKYLLPLIVIFFSCLLVFNTIPYFTFGRHYSFIQERILLFEIPFYVICFYTHIAAGSFCILSALLQFSAFILKKQRSLHIWSGRIYVMVVLVVAAPTGMFMAFFAKGSNAERALFMLMALIWFYTTARGLQTVLEKKILAHKQWMLRSYSMAMTAVTFRIYHLLFYYLGWSHLENYEISLWISVVGNILMAEAIIYYKNNNYKQSFTT